MSHVNQGKNRKKGNLQSKDDGEGEGEGEGKRGSEKKKRSIMRKNHNTTPPLYRPRIPDLVFAMDYCSSLSSV